MKSPPTRVDRYPAKMVSRLAAKLVDRYALDADRVLDPFCGSGAILVAAPEKGIGVSGIDINPYATLLATVKLQGFNPSAARDLCSEIIEESHNGGELHALTWDSKNYWFTSATLKKYERLRAVVGRRSLRSSPEGMAVLLAIALS